MATEVWCELVCAHCAQSAPEGRYTVDGRVPRQELKKSATASGWVFSGREAFCSPAHRDLKATQERITDATFI